MANDIVYKFSMTDFTRGDGKSENRRSSDGPFFSTIKPVKIHETSRSLQCTRDNPIAVEIKIVAHYNKQDEKQSKRKNKEI